MKKLEDFKRKVEEIQASKEKAEQGTARMFKLGVFDWPDVCHPRPNRTCVYAMFGWLLLLLNLDSAAVCSSTFSDFVPPVHVPHKTVGD